MLKKLALILTAAALLCGCKDSQKPAPKIAVEMWTTHNYSLEESVVGLSKIGVGAIETTPIQKISKRFGNALFDHSSTIEQRQFVKKLLDGHAMKICTIYCRPPKDEADLAKLMDFGDFFGVKLYVSESKSDMLPMWEKMCAKHGARMAIHCHQRGSGTEYWNPENVRKIVDKYPHIGFCAETGAWSRSGIDPVKALKIADGKIFALHLKDQKTFGDLKSEGVNYGTGVLDMGAILAELKRQKFDGWYVIEQGDDQQNAFRIVQENFDWLAERL